MASCLYCKHVFESLLQRKVSPSAILVHVYLHCIEAIQTGAELGPFALTSHLTVSRQLSTRAGLSLNTAKSALSELTQLTFMSGKRWVEVSRQAYRYRVKLRLPDPHDDEHNVDIRLQWWD